MLFLIKEQMNGTENAFRNIIRTALTDTGRLDFSAKSVTDAEAKKKIENRHIFEAVSSDIVDSSVLKNIQGGDSHFVKGRIEAALNARTPHPLFFIVRSGHDLFLSDGPSKTEGDVTCMFNASDMTFTDGSAVITYSLLECDEENTVFLPIIEFHSDSGHPSVHRLFSEPFYDEDEVLMFLRRIKRKKGLTACVLPCKKEILDSSWFEKEYTAVQLMAEKNASFFDANFLIQTDKHIEVLKTL